MVRTVALLFFVTVAALRAADVTLTDGTVFRNATTAKHDNKTTAVTFAGGAALVKTEMIIPANLLSGNGSGTTTTNAAAATPPDPADAPEPVEPINPAVRPAVNRAAWTTSGRIIQVNPNGIIARLQTLFTHTVTVPHTEKKTVDVVPSGLGHTPVYQTENHTWTTDEMVTDKIDLGTVYVSCPTPGLIDGQEWSGNIWRIGSYTHTTTLGARQTLAKYTAKPLEAYAFFTAHPESIPSPLQAPVANAPAGTAASPNPNVPIETPDAGPTINTTTDSLTVPPMNGK